MKLTFYIILGEWRKGEQVQHLAGVDTYEYRPVWAADAFVNAGLVYIYPFLWYIYPGYS